jgi:hypothetical protein
LPRRTRTRTRRTRMTRGGPLARTVHDHSLLTIHGRCRGVHWSACRVLMSRRFPICTCSVPPLL